jgi:hypothetical protein
MTNSWLSTYYLKLICVFYLIFERKSINSARDNVTNIDKWTKRTTASHLLASMNTKYAGRTPTPGLEQAHEYGE